MLWKCYCARTKNCCFCTWSSGNRRHFQKLFGGTLYSDIEDIVFSVTVKLKEAFLQQSVMCRNCGQLVTTFTKKRQELQEAEAAVRSLLSASLRLAPPSASPAILPVLCSIGERRPQIHVAASTPKRLRLSLQLKEAKLVLDNRHHRAAELAIIHSYALNYTVDFRTVGQNGKWQNDQMV